MVTEDQELLRHISGLVAPGWLQDAGRRAAALEAASELPRWDRTSSDGLALAPGALPVGGHVEIGVPPGAAERGVVAGGIAQLAAAQPELVRAHLGRIVPAELGKFEARNAAGSQGSFIYVPPGVSLAEPVEVTYCLGPEAPAQFHPRTVVVLGRGAEASVLQRETGGHDGSVVTAVVEADLADGARLRFMELQNWGAGVRGFAHRRAELGRDAQMQWLQAEMGAGLMRSGTTSVLRGVGGEALALLVFFASGRQHLDLLAGLVHHGARTNGLMLARGVLTGQARTIYRGTSDIRRGAKGSNSQQKEKSLHLGGEVRSDAIPALYIDENELQAGHAATTGRVNEEELFYLQSRGLPRREAERLIVHGFFAPLVEQIPLEAARAELTGLVDRKLDQPLDGSGSPAA